MGIILATGMFMTMCNSILALPENWNCNLPEPNMVLEMLSQILNGSEPEPYIWFWVVPDMALDPLFVSSVNLGTRQEMLPALA